MTVLQIIEQDLAACGGWLEDEAEAAAKTAWADISKLLTGFTAAQYTVVQNWAKQLLQSVEGDPLVLFTPEVLATMALNDLLGQELVEAESLSPAAVVAIVALAKL